MAYVVVEGIDVNIIVDDMQDRNRAQQGFTVAVELYPESEWIPYSHQPDKDKDEDDKKIATTPAASTDAELDIRSMHITNRVDNNPQQLQGLWRPRDDLLQSFHSSNKPDQIALTASSVHPLDQISTNSKKQPRGKVVAIMQTCDHKHVVGALSTRATLRPNEPLPETESFVTFHPSDGRIPYMIVPRVQLPDAFIANPHELISHIFVADLVTDWPITSNLPFGENVRSVGEVGSIQAETEALLIENGLNHGIFTDDVIEPLRQLLGISTLDITSGAAAAGNWKIPAAEIAKRRDLRAYRIFTIDPSGARDLDDALHITPIPPDPEELTGEVTYEVGVHIADVSHFVVPDTPLDAEARNRATSIYLVQKVIPMLPPILCEQLCSLNPNVDRLAFSVIFRMTQDGNLVAGHKPWFGRTVIRSCAKLDYITAQRMVDGEIPNKPSASISNCDADIDTLSDDVWNFSRRPSKAVEGEDNRYVQNAWEIAQDVCVMHRVAMSRRSRRLENGALVLNRPKLTFRLDENGNPSSTSCYIIRESNQLIEEYMLLANYLVAEKLLETVGAISFLRCHPPPDMKGLGTLVDLSRHIGYDLDTTSALTLQESLKHISETADSTTIRVITSLIMLPMNRAEYFAVGETEPSKWRHYALSIPYYTHFTSPIRRYADVMVHRLLEEGLRIEASGPTTPLNITSAGGDSSLVFDHARYETIQEIASHCNTQKNAAKAAQERSDAVYLSIFLVNNPIITEGIVSGIGEKSFTVLVLDYSFESRIFIDKMHNVDSTFDEKEKTLVLRHRPHNAESKGCFHEFSELTISLMSRVQVRLTADMKPPISTKVDLVNGMA